MRSCSTADGEPVGELHGAGFALHGAAARAIRQQAEMPDAHEAGRDDVQEKASEEFVGLEGHDLWMIVGRKALPTGRTRPSP